MMQKIEIKKVGLNDVEHLQNISIQIFCETSAAYNTEADINKYIDESFALDQLISELKNIGSQAISQ